MPWPLPRRTPRPVCVPPAFAALAIVAHMQVLREALLAHPDVLLVESPRPSLPVGVAGRILQVYWATVPCPVTLEEVRRDCTVIVHFDDDQEMHLPLAFVAPWRRQVAAGPTADVSAVDSLVVEAERHILPP